MANMKKRKSSWENTPYWLILIAAITFAFVAHMLVSMAIDIFNTYAPNNPDYLYAEEQIDEWQTAYADYSQLSDDTVRLSFLRGLSVKIDLSIIDFNDDQSEEVLELHSLIDSDIDELENGSNEQEAAQ